MITVVIPVKWGRSQLILVKILIPVKRGRSQLAWIHCIFKPFSIWKVSHTWGSGCRSMPVGVNKFWNGRKYSVCLPQQSKYFDPSLWWKTGCFIKQKLDHWEWSNFHFLKLVFFCWNGQKIFYLFPTTAKKSFNLPFFLNRRRDPSLVRRLTIGSDQPLFCEVGHPLLSWGYQNFSFWKMLN